MKIKRITIEQFREVALKHGFAVTTLREHFIAKESEVYLKVIDPENMVVLVFPQFSGLAYIHRIFLWRNVWYTTNSVENCIDLDDFEEGIEKVMTIRGEDRRTLLGEF